jgi:hypothetical protein
MNPAARRRALQRGGEGDEPEFATYLRIEERELETGGRN